MKKQIGLKDITSYTFLSNLSYSPNKQKYACIRSNCDEEKKNYQHALYVKDEKGMKELAQMGAHQLFIWDNDNELLFADLRSQKDRDMVQEGLEKTCFYRISLHGGEAKKVFDIPLTVNSITKISDQQYILGVWFDEDFSTAYSQNETARRKVLAKQKALVDYEIVDETPFYMNGMGYINKHREALFLYDVKKHQCTRISEPYLNVETYEINENKDEIVYIGAKYMQMQPNQSAIYVYNMKTGKTKEILGENQYHLYDVQFYGDRFFFVASSGKRYGRNENPWFYEIDRKGNIEILYEYDHSLGSSVGSDCRYGGGRYAKLIDEKYYFITTIDNSSQIYAYDFLTKQCQPITNIEGSIDCFDVNGKDVIMIALHHMKLQEIYAYDIDKKVEKQISKCNENVFKKQYIAPCEKVEFIHDNETFNGWVLKPYHFDSKKKYPAILDIHGGPKTVYGEVFYHEMQYWASQGYFVFFMNPKGSDGRGNAFMDIRGAYGTCDYEEIMKFTEVVLQKYKNIDIKNIGVTGGSYGGFMTNWIIGHTDIFKAAASQRSIANWLGFEFTSDIGPNFTVDQQGASLYDNPEKLWWHSPLKYTEDVVTPTLFIHSTEDHRCPLSEGIQMYNALALRGVETRLCIFKGENHELSRSGKPLHRIKRLEEITTWMDQYLKSGKK